MSDWSVERVVTDHAVEVHVHDQATHVDAVLTQDEARHYADGLLGDDDFVHEVLHAARDADLCRCGHRLAAWGDLCGVCSTALEPSGDAA